MDPGIVALIPLTAHTNRGLAVKITDVIPHVIKPGLPGDTPDQSAWAFIEIRTDEGITGWGEATKYGRGGSFLIGQAIHMVKDDFIGEDPANIEVLWHKLYRRFTYTGARGFPTALLAGFDMALWDIKGKATGRPVFDLLGGKFRNPVPLYANVWFEGAETPEEYAVAAKKMVALGHTASKHDPFHEMKPFHSMYQDGKISKKGENIGYDIVAAVREAVGPDHELLIDAHGHYNVPTAIRLANTLFEQSDITWFEEPVPPESFEALKQVRQNTSAPICVGERLFTRYDFLPIFRDGLADYIMPDTIWTGGISEIKRIAIMAEAYYIPISPHCVPAGPLELISAAHVCASVPNFYRLEHSILGIPMQNDLLTEPMEISNGSIHLNEKPGLGYDLDPDVLAAKRHPLWEG
jgi:galactonate dehydratase